MLAQAHAGPEGSVYGPTPTFSNSPAAGRAAVATGLTGTQRRGVSTPTGSTRSVSAWYEAKSG
jgi:hypothetical protein